jgi:Uma2 family endonuclease
MATQALITAEDLIKMPDDSLCYELVRGELRKMPPAGFDHGTIITFLPIQPLKGFHVCRLRFSFNHLP